MERLPMLMDRQDEHYEVAVLPKAVFRFSAVPTQTSMQFFTEVEKTTSYGNTKVSGQLKQS